MNHDQVINARSRRPVASLRRGAAIVLVAYQAVAFAGCRSAGPAVDAQAPAAAPAMTAERARLLSSADEVAGLIPGEDCEVDRSSDRASIVECCIALGDLDRAEAFAAKIENWRRGDELVRIGRARLAAGDRAGAERCAARCLADAGGWRDWGISRVSAGAAALYVALGEPSRAKGLLPPDAPDLQGAFEASRVATVPPSELPALADAFDAALRTQNLDVARSALDGHLEILRRTLGTGDDAAARRARSALDAGIGGLPPDLQVTYLLRMADALAAAGRVDDARTAVARAGEAFSKANLEAQSRAATGVPIAEMEFRLGDRAAALARVEGLRADFEARREEITDLRRATALRALAEGFWMLGERDRAARCYADALREGAVNPNARPRANDLCETLVSMARCGFVPDAAMGRTIASTRAGLVAPW